MDNTNTSNGGEESVALGERIAGKYMTFKLANEEYGFELLKVREIIGMLEITRVPRCPHFVRGVINLRGRIIPVVDLRMKFDMEAADALSQNVIIVVQYMFAGEEVTTGILVDEVVEVLDVSPNDTEPPPTYGGETINTDFILGVAKAGKRVVFLIDISRVLSGEETDAMFGAMI